MTLAAVRSTPALDPIFDNHLAFLDAHRGSIRAGPGWNALDGRAPFLSFVAPLSDAVAIDADCSAVWTYPWSGASWASKLDGLGFSQAGEMSYMELSGPLTAAPRRDVSIQTVQSEAEADEFAAIQARGFLTADSPDREWWRRCFLAMARCNHADPNQTLLLARVGEKPVAVLLAVRAGGVAGIYAVATDPNFRREGLSTALLHRAGEDAVEKSAGPLVLQAMTGSYAEGFYARAGFELRYRCQMWRRR